MRQCQVSFILRSYEIGPIYIANIYFHFFVLAIDGQPYFGVIQKPFLNETGLNLVKIYDLW